MMKEEIARTAAPLFTSAQRAFLAALLLCLSAAGAPAQSTATDLHTPPSLAPGAPAGSYALSDFDNINLYNGNLNFRLPLVKVGDRGSASYTMTLPIEQHWRVSHWWEYDLHSPSYNPWQGLEPGYGPGVLQGRQTHEGCGDGGPYPDGNFQAASMTTLTFTAPDGTEYELRDAQTNGNFQNSICCCYYNNSTNGASRGTVFKSVDGSGMTFVSDSTVYDWSGNIESGPHILSPTGTLIFSDGTRYRVEWGQVVWIRDRHGNQLTFEYNSPYGVTRVTDSLGRQTTVEYGVNDPQYGYCDRITFTGFGGAARRIWVAKTNLSSALRPGYSIQTYAQLFPGLNGSWSSPFDPGGMVSSVWLPDGRRYQFLYNSYGELARAALPTGGYFEYDWDWGNGAPCVPMPEIFRRVAERRAYRDAGALEGWTTYQTGAPTVVSSYAPDGTLLARRRHYFHSATYCGGPIGHPQWNDGKEYQTEELAADGATVLRRVSQTWQQTPPSWFTGNWWSAEPANNPKVITTVTTVEPGGANLVSKTTAVNPHNGAIGFDQFNNQTDLWEYDFGAGAPPPYPSRHTHTDFLTTNPANGVNYTSNAVHILRLARAQQTYAVNPSNGAETLVAQSETLYDEPAYPTISYGAVSGWVDPGTAARGNPTTSRRWLDTTGGWLETHAQYDQVGNLRNSWDARGNLSQTLYDDAFSDGVPRNTYAYPTRSVSPVPDPTGQHGSATAHVATAVYDFSTGAQTLRTDANNRTTAFQYNDPLDRLTRVDRPGGGWTAYTYDRSMNAGVLNEYVLTQTALDASRATHHYQFFDGLGRPTRTFLHEGGSVFSTTDTRYDALGRVWRVSEPYRTTGSHEAVNLSGRWTETTYDALGRVTKVKTTADGGEVTTAYSGNAVTVTDQAGKSKRTVTDAFGRLVQVVEDPYGAAHATNYAYDALDNLRRTEQGGQLRFFMYDSLSRLIRARNPEQATLSRLDYHDPVTGNGQWSMAYGYDAEGNLTTRIDARNVETTYAYDALGRNISVSYSDGTMGVGRVYDKTADGVGRLSWDWNCGASGCGSHAVYGYDAAGRVQVRHQYFWANGGWGQPYSTSYSYDLAGNVTGVTYPSGRAVSYGYDDAARVNNFSGTLGDGAGRAYSSAFVYDEDGRPRQERYGTDTPVYNKRFYNARGQMNELRVSTYPLDAPGQETNWNRGALINRYSNQSWSGSGTDNNGNLLLQMVYVPNDDQISGYQMNALRYSYDGLNRLDKVEELLDGWQFSWQQDYDYDRWGNRTVNAANTTDWMPEPQFTVDPATNRLGVPAGYPGVMQYDAAGNLTYDTHTGQGSRSYDAENRIVSAQDAFGQTSTYGYDADGRRTRRRVAGGQEVWQVYDADGDLLAEYAEGSPPTQPRREYGYRGGELLVQASAPVSSGTGLTAQYFDNNNFTNLRLTRTDATVNFDWGGGSPHATIGADTFSAKWTGKVEPRYSQTYTFYTVTDDGVRLWVNNQLVIDKWIDQAPTEWSGQIALTAGQRYDIRLEFYENYGGATAKLLWSSPSQPKEVVPQSQLYPTNAANAQVEFQWFVHDQLGSPRMVIDKSGSLATVKRRDFLPFGEEIAAGVSGRSYQQGYGGDGVRQKFTGKERDWETGLDYFEARYYSPVMGRFLSPDEFTGGPDELYDFVDDAAENPTIYADLEEPRSLNKYQYCYNDPLNNVDPDGHNPLKKLVKVAVKAYRKGSVAAAFADDVQDVKTVFSPGASTGERIIAGVSVVSEYVSPVSLRDGKTAVGWIKSGIRRLRGTDALDDAVKRGAHVANVRILEEGKTIARSREVSGNMTQAQKAMGFPRGQLASHTEAKAVRNNNLKRGQSMVITGTRRPCPSCKGEMNKAARQTGAKIRYQWRDAGRTRRWNAHGGREQQ